MDEDKWVKKNALDAIGYFGKEGADYLLLKSNIYSKNSELYSNFIEALARTGVEQAHEKILSIAADNNNDASLRIEALKSLQKIFIIQDFIIACARRYNNYK
jgi:HEAT repeat protein